VVHYPRKEEEDTKRLGLRMPDDQELMPGVVMKNLRNAAADAPCPEYNQWVRYSCVGRRTSGEILFTQNEFWSKIGDGDVCPGLELGLRSLRLMATADIECEARFAFGSPGRPDAVEGDVLLPPDTPVSFEVTMLELGSSAVVGNMGCSDRLEEAQKKRTIGNHCFLYQDYERASKCYGASLKAVDGILSSDEADTPAAVREDVLRLMLDCGNNLAAAYLKLANYPKAEAASVAVLQIDPSNVKALYRGGVAAMEQHMFVEARLAFAGAKELAPKDQGVARQFRELEKREKLYKAKELRMMKQMSKRILGSSSGKAESPPPPPQLAEPSKEDEEVVEPREGDEEIFIETPPRPKQRERIISCVLIAFALAVVVVWFWRSPDGRGNPTPRVLEL
jgi:tetratricopeptide (TPR) repeat protein